MKLISRHAENAIFSFEIMKNKKEVNSDENITPVKNKGEKESSSSSTETSPSPAKREEQKFVTP